MITKREDIYKVDLSHISDGNLPPMHPGEMLREEYMEPLEINTYQLAKALNVPYRRIELICKEKSGISADTAIRLAKYFGTTPQFWMRLQDDYEIGIAFENNSSHFEKVHRRLEMA